MNPRPAAIDGQKIFKPLFFDFPDALLLVDDAGTIVLANASAERLFGFAPEGLTGLKVETLVPDAARARHAAHRSAYGHDPRTRPMGTRIDLAARRKDGSEVTVEIALSPLQVGPQRFVVTAIRDVGDYPRFRQALVRARHTEHLARLGRLAADTRDPQGVVDRVPAIVASALEVEVATIYLLEPDGRRLRIAAGVGSAPGQAIGTLIDYRPDVSPGLVVSQGRTLAVSDYRTERRFAAPPGFLEAGLVSALVVAISDRGRFIGALAARTRQARDYGDDEQRFLESAASLLATSLQRAQSEDALRHSQRLESVGQLTGGIAHDFNNLLTVIRGNLQVLGELGDGGQPAYREQLVAAAMRAAGRGAELTTKLLAFSRRQVLQPARVDVVAMIESLAEMLRRTLDPRILIDIDSDPARPCVMADAGQLESALLNIAINARDAMPDGGTLRFRVLDCDRLPGDLAEEIDGAAPDVRYAAISVSDTGCGMTSEVRERVFEPFYTTKPAGRGTGLGLSTVYGFVKQSRGAVRLDSAPGAGTTVTLFIPRHDAGQEAAPNALPTAAVPPGLKVLLVEDDDDVRAVLCTFLDALRCHVTAVGSAAEALAWLDVCDGFDLLVTDIALRGALRGTQLAERVHERLPRAGILLMSGFAADLFDADRDAPARWEFLGKPCMPRELAHAMARALQAAGNEATRPAPDRP